MRPGANLLALIEASLREAPPETVAFFRRERDAAREKLAEARSARDVARVVEQATERLEPLVAELTRERPPACGRGCSLCCHGLKIEVSAPEAVTIAEYLRELGPEELAETRAQLREEADFARTIDADTRWREQTACAFLEDASGQCLIYEVRPLTCRAHSSMSLEDCERAAEDAERRTPVTRHPAPEAIFGLEKSAVTVACGEAGLDPRSFELTSAVSVALSEPEAAERWARGERVFDAAVTPSDEVDAQISLHLLGRSGLLPPERLLKRPLGQSERNAAKRERRGRRGRRAKGR